MNRLTVLTIPKSKEVRCIRQMLVVKLRKKAPVNAAGQGLLDFTLKRFSNVTKF